MKKTYICMKQVVCSFISSLFFIAATAQTFSGSTGSIPDNLTEKCFSATVSGLSGNLNPTKGLAKVCLDVSYAFNYTTDLDIFLITPNGERIMLSTDNSFTSFNSNGICFTPEATVKITDG